MPEAHEEFRLRAHETGDLGETRDPGEERRSGSIAQGPGMYEVGDDLLNAHEAAVRTTGRGPAERPLRDPPYES